MKTNHLELALKLEALVDRVIENEDRATLLESARALCEARRELDFLAGRAEGCQRGMDIAIRRLASVTSALWPQPVMGRDLKLYDGTPEAKIKAHDAARRLATMPASDFEREFL